MNKYENLKVIKGDILVSDCDIIIHQANCQGIMGAGLAKQIKNKYPKVFQADKQYKISIGSKERLGKYSYAKAGEKVIVNLYSQYRYGRGKRHTNYEALEEGLQKLLEEIKENKTVKIGVPYIIGAGLAGGEPEVILSILEKTAEKYGRTIYMYQYKGKG